ncbi:hypothetical protein M4951_16890 [Blastopirellula sp. J2-11]|uniref:hypothetical protein n=1 Tax=Blastopirellula sp. J2-11 TaxID=2943192 RepID=UPI0021C5C32A|nr:hypothetical protein [Blastopirellula sp. J2-11]UUO05055.1 hypothetical protein M4951_16890 [Blastopirellula sp. J2-11]
MSDIRLLLGVVLVGWLLMHFARFGLIEILILYAVVFAAVIYWRRLRIAAQQKKRRELN